MRVVSAILKSLTVILSIVATNIAFPSQREAVPTLLLVLLPLVTLAQLCGFWCTSDEQRGYLFSSRGSSWWWIPPWQTCCINLSSLRLFTHSTFVLLMPLALPVCAMSCIFWSGGRGYDEVICHIPTVLTASICPHEHLLYVSSLLLTDSFCHPRGWR